jgi:hypothetical protein
MDDLAKQGLTTDKLKTGMYFWLGTSVGFALIFAVCAVFTLKTAWAVIPLLGFGLLTYSAVRFTLVMGRAYLFIRRALKKSWYQPIDGKRDEKVKEIIQDLEVPCKVIAHRSDMYSPTERIACFANDKDFVKFSLRA